MIGKEKYFLTVSIIIFLFYVLFMFLLFLLVRLIFVIFECKIILVFWFQIWMWIWPLVIFAKSFAIEQALFLQKSIFMNSMNAFVPLFLYLLLSQCFAHNDKSIVNIKARKRSLANPSDPRELFAALYR